MDHAEANAALEQERLARKEVESMAEAQEAKRPIAEELGRQLNFHLKSNHFGDLVMESMRRRKQA